MGGGGEAKQGQCDSGASAAGVTASRVVPALIKSTLRLPNGWLVRGSWEFNGCGFVPMTAEMSLTG
jgi:hypothetical protein